MGHPKCHIYSNTTKRRSPDTWAPLSYRIAAVAASGIKARCSRRKKPPKAGLGGPKSRPGRSRRRKKSISTKVLRDPPLPMRQTLRTSPNRPQVGSKSILGASSDPSSDLLGRLRLLEGASGGLSERLGATRAASGAPRGRPGSLEPPRRARYFRDLP